MHSVAVEIVLIEKINIVNIYMVDLSLVSWNTPFSDIHQSDIYEHQSDILNLLSTYQHVAEYEHDGHQSHHKFNYNDSNHPLQIYKFMEEKYPLHDKLGILFQYRHSLPPKCVLLEIKRINPSNKELYEFKENIHHRIEHIAWFNILNELNLKNIFKLISLKELNNHIYNSIMEKQHLMHKLPLHTINKLDKKQSAIKSKSEPEKKEPEKKEPEKKKPEKKEPEKKEPEKKKPEKKKSEKKKPEKKKPEKKKPEKKKPEKKKPEKKKPEKKEPEKKKSEKRSKPYNPLTKTLKKKRKEGKEKK